jgi:hypothetical protein
MLWPDAFQSLDQVAAPATAALGSSAIAFAVATPATAVRNEGRFPILRS